MNCGRFIVERPATIPPGYSHEHHPHHRLLLRLRPRNRPPLPRPRLERDRHHAHSQPRPLPRSERLRVLALDVTRPASIAAALAAAGPIDVLVNNAGIGTIGVFEATPMATVREVFETNTFGVMAMTQAVVPQFREKRSGVVVNVTSSVTLAAMPLAAAYTASKTAITGFTGSLAHELGAFGVKVKLVEPGYGLRRASPPTSAIGMDGVFPETYAAFPNPIMAAFARRQGIHPGIRRRRSGLARGARRDRPAPLPGRRRRGRARPGALTFRRRRSEERLKRARIEVAAETSFALPSR